MCNLHCNHYLFYFIFFHVISRLSTLIDHISVGRRLEVVSVRYTPQQLSLTDDTRVLRFLNPFPLSPCHRINDPRDCRGNAQTFNNHTRKNVSYCFHRSAVRTIKIISQTTLYTEITAWKQCRHTEKNYNNKIVISSERVLYKRTKYYV